MNTTGFALQFRHVAILALTLGVSGCSGCDHEDGMGGASAGADGIPCTGIATNDPVYIDVSYASDGTPSVSVNDCHIDSNTQVTWRGPNAEPVQFKIAFKAATPIADEAERGELPSVAAGDGRQKVVRVLSGNGTYTYAVKANGKVLDPAIIIRAN